MPNFIGSPPLFHTIYTAAKIECDVQQHIEKVCSERVTTHRNSTPALLAAETSILNLSTLPCCSGIFYALPLTVYFSGERFLYIRYFESGNCYGFFESTFKNEIRVKEGNRCNILGNRVHTSWDQKAMENHQLVDHRRQSKCNDNSTCISLLNVNIFIH